MEKNCWIDPTDLCNWRNLSGRQGSHLCLRVPRAKKLTLPIVLCLGYGLCPKAEINILKSAEASMCNCLPLPYANHRDVTSCFLERVILIACRWPSSSSRTKKYSVGKPPGGFWMPGFWFNYSSISKAELSAFISITFQWCCNPIVQEKAFVSLFFNFSYLGFCLAVIGGKQEMCINLNLCMAV